MESNREQLEKILNSYFKKCLKGGSDDSTEQELRLIIRMVHVLDIQSWEPDATIVKLLLEYFYSKINEASLLPSFGPWITTFAKYGFVMYIHRTMK